MNQEEECPKCFYRYPKEKEKKTKKILGSDDVMEALDRVETIKTHMDAGKRLAYVVAKWEEEGEDRIHNLKWTTERD